MKRDGGTGFNEFSLGYEYDTGGNITKVTHSTNTAWNASYTYDSQNQLTQEVNKNGTYNYTYDTGGNIRSVSGAETHTYTYGDSEWLDLLTAYDGKAITYDTIGNPAVWHNDTGDWNLSWSNGRQLTRATKGSHIVSYTYDLAGIRDSKTVDGVTYNYITQNGQVVRQTWTSGGTSHVMDFIYDNTGKPYAMWYGGDIYYYVLNLQGDVISIVTRWGESYGSYTYDAWGNIIAQAGWLAAINPIRYRGYYYDSETGLYYLGSRYYDPQVGRFVNADCFASTGQGFIACNMFCYCSNNPVMAIDPTGKSFWFGAFLAGPNTWGFLQKVEKIYEWVNGTLHPEYSKSNRPQSLNDYRTPDGTYAAYDNHNFNPNSIFHEQILAVDIDGFGFDDGLPSYVSAGVTAITGGWETDNFDLSLLDFGRAEASIGFGETGVAFYAMATAYKPSVSYDFGPFNVSISANIGSVGAGFDLREGQLDLGAALGLGAQISIGW